MTQDDYGPDESLLPSSNQPAPLPSPGSTQATDAGCKCPVIDNHYGAGRPGPNGRRLFIYTQGCPVHDDDNLFPSEAV